MRNLRVQQMRDHFFSKWPIPIVVVNMAGVPLLRETVVKYKSHVAYPFSRLFFVRPTSR